MPDIITLGETMAMFAPEVIGRLRYSSEYHMRIAGALATQTVGDVEGYPLQEEMEQIFQKEQIVYR